MTASCPLPTIQQDIRIPCALRGGQKKETKAQAVPVKRRLTVKTKDIVKNQSGKCAGKKASMSAKLSVPCKLVRRVKDAKGYILDKKKDVCLQCIRKHERSFLYEGIGNLDQRD